MSCGNAPTQSGNRIQMTDLKLLALDAEDLQVISATTQDAIVRAARSGGLSYLSASALITRSVMSMRWLA